MEILSPRVRQNFAKVPPTIGLDFSSLEKTQQEIIRLHQQQAFKDEVETLTHSGYGDRKTLRKEAVFTN